MNKYIYFTKTPVLNYIVIKTEQDAMDMQKIGWQMYKLGVADDKLEDCVICECGSTSNYFDTIKNSLRI